MTDQTVETQQKPKILRAKDLILACLTADGKNLSTLPITPTAPVVRTAARYLDENNCSTQAERLRSFAKENWGIVARPGRGRLTPEKGDVRDYRVQSVQGSLFIRLPVSALKVAQGDILTVSFGDDAIHVRR